MLARSSVIAGLAVIALTAGSVSAVAAIRDSPQRATVAGSNPMTSAVTCAVPRLPGTSVTVVLSDMPGYGRMAGGGMMQGWRATAGIGTSPNVMALRVSPQRAAAGTVSIVAYNRGMQVHELVVLPLSDGATAGSRSVGADGVISEAASLGEASENCGGGSGEGISPQSAGWVTLTLQAGRYELLCNLPGHYAAGMFAELDVR